MTSCLLAAVALSLASAPPLPSISLAGPWQFEFDRNDAGATEGWASRALSDKIDLPTTTDQAQKGPLVGPSGNPWNLTRTHPYIGVAWYRRSISVPAAWKGRGVWLKLERTKATTVFIDGRSKDQQNWLSTAQIYDLGKLKAGEHTIALRVDNRLVRWPDRVTASHMLEESTQTNWNGVIGDIQLSPDGDSTIMGVTSWPGTSAHQLHVRANFVGSDAGRFTVKAFDGAREVAESSSLGPQATLNFASALPLWDEFHPKLYRLVATLQNSRGASTWTGSVGLRDFHAADASFWINGRRIFLRGKHDGCVFPLTGHPPMEEAGWDRYFGICKQYGINHVRFHSWCPPEAAFASADRLGMYLQPELPFWGDPGKPGVEAFLVAEGKRILLAYGNHPSFVMLSLGNEFWGDPAPRPRMVAALRSTDPSRLYDQGSNSESWNAHEFAGDDYRVSAFVRTTDVGEARGSYAHGDKHLGFIIAGTHGTLHTYSEALADTKQPFISHEVGQYDTFPDFREIAEYMGVARADNLILFRDRLEKAGMLDQDDQFVQASGRLSAILYREEIEAALRTPRMSGFDLLDLQDYPGQGTSLVGMLDAFMDSKGLITPEKWREFCGPVVPLAMFSKYTWQSNEKFSAEVRVANYGPDNLSGPVSWRLSEGDQTLDSGKISLQNIPTGTASVCGSLSADLSGVKCPAKISLTLEVGGKSSSWPLWVYGPTSTDVPPNVTMATKLDAETLSRLARGARVLLFPNLNDLKESIPGDFATDFWNYPMFKGGNPPGTLGYLIQDKHPALAEFPTEFHSDWQWQTVAHHSRTVILDDFPDLKPIVQTIDNFERNHRLGTVFEVKIGPGRLLVCTIDLPHLQGEPEARQLMRSLLDYVASTRFDPVATVGATALGKALYGAAQ
jgi:hypothetical protein